MKHPWEKTTDELKEARDKANAEATTWEATCPVCHVHMSGTLAQLKSHKCEVPDVYPK